MALQRSYLKKLMLSLFDAEASYNAGPAGWTSGSACSMLEFPDAAGYEEWDDTIQSNLDVVVGNEFLSKQEIVRQSLRLTYEEPRVKPNTLAGLAGLVLGSVSSTQDGVLTAYRHKLVQASSVGLTSIAAQTLRDTGVQRKYTGLKGDSFTLSHNDAYFTFSCPLIGSGTRATAIDDFTATIVEKSLRWGDAKIYLKDVTNGVIPIPSAPSQTGANLDGSETNFSTRVLSLELGFQNNLAAEQGYRASTGNVRGNFHTTRRTATLRMSFETDSDSESVELNHYLNQVPLAFELNINSGTIIATEGVFMYGAIFVIPQMRLRTIRRTPQNDFETIEYEADVFDDGTNPQMVGWVFNSKAAYLA
jgi:hypothetical protein